MNKIIQTAIAAILLVSCSTNKVLKEANTHYDNLEYHTAAVKYNEYLKTHKDDMARIKLAECYVHMNHFSEAEKEYAAVIAFPTITSQNELHYAHILKHNGKYDEARKWYTDYLLANPTDAAVISELRSCDSLKNYIKYSYQYEVSPVFANETESNFSPAFFKNGIVFASERSKPTKTVGVSQWTGHSYLDIYFSEIFANIENIEPVSLSKAQGGPNSNEILAVNKFSEPVPFSKVINSPYNEGPVCFSQDEKTIYFTRNILDKKNKPEINSSDVNNLEIYKSVYEEGVWSTPELLNFDNKDYSIGHPALSKNEKRLYFISDKPGGLGGTDLYYSDFANGKWSEPINLGSGINTSENEMFPTIIIDETGKEYLYFSSEGMPGMGGLDLYYVNVTNSGFGKPVHLNAPLNSSGDDFGIIYTKNGLEGFLSSNRNNEDGIDKIYYFKKYIPEFYMEITVKKKGTNEIIPNVMVDLKFSQNNEEDVASTDQNGKLFRKIVANTNVEITGKKDFFFTASTKASNIGKIFSDTMHLTLELEAIVINKPIRLDNIYYDYNKWDIRPDAKPELDKLVKVMKENPGIFIELSSHTDSRGGDNFNLKLSQKRAESAVEYIIGNGIASERICAKGYGKTKLLNHCKSGVKCSEEEHQLNRRTEFKVTKVCTTKSLTIK